MKLSFDIGCNIGQTSDFLLPRKEKWGMRYLKK
jgi:hypothetical protein